MPILTLWFSTVTGGSPVGLLLSLTSSTQPASGAPVGLLLAITN